MKKGKVQKSSSTGFAYYAAELCVEFYVKCKQWGFLLKKLFGIHLGTGDYGHLTIDHSAMLLHQFHSLYHYFGQGFESSH